MWTTPFKKPPLDETIDDWGVGKPAPIRIHQDRE